MRLVQDTLVIALERWRVDGIPDRPSAWLTTTARRRAIDRLRRDGAYRHKLALLAAEPFAPADPDDRLQLIFVCCHPARCRDAQLAPLTGLLGTLYPRHAETLGLLALIRLHLARAGSRFRPPAARGSLRGAHAAACGTSRRRPSCAAARPGPTGSPG